MKTVLIVLICLLLQACQTPPITPAPDPKLFIKTELLFGLSHPSGKIITEEEWLVFVENKITPLLPQGFTVLDGYGQWLNDEGFLHKERAKLLILLHPDHRKFDELIEEIRRLYKTQFQQESVIRFTTPTRVDF